MAGLVVNHATGAPLVVPIAAAAVAGFGLFVMAGATPAALGLLADISEAFPNDRGAIMGLYSVFLAVGQIIGALIGGVAADARGIDGMLIATGLLLAVALLPLAQLRRDEGGLGAHEGPGRRPVTDGRPWVPVPLARGTHGAVVAPHHLATEAGLHVLRQGGSAVDAAIATNAVLGVVMPSGCGIGGDAFWLIWDAAAGRQTAINGSGRAPSAADAAALRAGGLTTIPKRGPLSITVPGAVRSWGDAHARHGRLSRDAILAPAIELARGRLPGLGRLHRGRRGHRAAGRPGHRPGRRLLRGLSPARPSRGGPGERVRLPALAATLGELARDGFDAFYDGELGERQGRGLAAAGSAITRRGPAGAREHLRRAHRHRLPGHARDDPPAQQLGHRRPGDPGHPGAPRRRRTATAFGPDGVTDAAWIHAGLEASRLAMADRDAYLTDPTFRDVPVATLLDPQRLSRPRRAHRSAAGRSPAAVHQPARWRHDLPGRRRR